MADYAEALTTYPACEQIKNYGFSTHEECYMAPIKDKPEINFCNLSYFDQMKIGWIAKGELM